MKAGILHYLGDAGRGRGIWCPTSLGNAVFMPPRPGFVASSNARFVASFLAVCSAALTLGGCGATADDLFCDDTGCGMSDLQWSRLSALSLSADSPLGPVPVDPSNGVFNDGNALTLGRWFDQDTRFSGLATQVDALGRPAAVARVPKGQPANVSCASCHDLGRMGVDVASNPGNVSSGAGWTDVNALPRR